MNADPEWQFCLMFIQNLIGLLLCRTKSNLLHLGKRDRDFTLMITSPLVSRANGMSHTDERQKCIYFSTNNKYLSRISCLSSIKLSLFVSRLKICCFKLLRSNRICATENYRTLQKRESKHLTIHSTNTSFTNLYSDNVNCYTGISYITIQSLIFQPSARRKYYFNYYFGIFK